MIQKFYEHSSDLSFKYLGFDGFGYVVNILLDNKKIGEIVYREKTYLETDGYPMVKEFHVGFKEDYQNCVHKIFVSYRYISKTQF